MKNKRSDKTAKVKTKEATYKILAMAYETSSQQIYCNTIFCDWYMVKDFGKRFNIKKSPEHLEKEIDLVFKVLKKEIESSIKDILLVINYPSKFSGSKTISGIMISVAVYIKPEQLSTSTIPNNHQHIMLVVDKINAAIDAEFAKC
jgi:hypothetical protein